MPDARLSFLAATALALAACGSQPPDPAPSNEAEAFAERIKGAAPLADQSARPSERAGEDASRMAQAPRIVQQPRVAEPLPGAAPGPFVPGTATDPEAAICGAPSMGPFLGKLADEATRTAIMDTIGGANEVRFVEVGADQIQPDPTSARLNLMLDRQNIIRDARCG